MNDVMRLGPGEVTYREPNAFEMKPRTLDEAMKFAEIMASSDLVPAGYKGKPGNILVACQMGHELGMAPMRALRSIAVINGRATLWGDDMLAMVMNSPICEYVNETESTDTVGIVKVKRKGGQEHISRFTLEDAKRAGLLGKSGPWQQHTARMLKLRARGFALRDVFPDVLAGLITAEEALDIPPTPLPLDTEKPQTLKDRLKAKVEETTSTILEEQLKQSLEALEKDTPEDNGAGSALGGVEDGLQPSNTPAPVFAESSAALDYEAAIEAAVSSEEVDGLWNDCVKDGRLTGPVRAKIYKKVQAKKKQLK